VKGVLQPRPRPVVLVSVLLSAALAALPGRAAAGEAGGKKYALLVGVRAYEHNKLKDLKYTENDVEELAVLLRGKAAGFDGVRVLTTSRGQANAADRPTAANIRRAVARLLDRRTKRDTVLVALAGHGVQLPAASGDGGKTRDEPFFCPADGEPVEGRTATLLSLAALFKQLDDSGAGVKLLLVDACRNDPHETRSLDADALPRPPRGVAAMYSCSSGQRAFETPRLGKNGHGVFFHFVLEGLKGEARNKDGDVTWGGLAEYVTKSVSRAVPKLIGGGAKQQPNVIANLSGESPVLTRPAAGPRPEPRPDPGATRLATPEELARPELKRAQAHLKDFECDLAVAACTRAIRLAPNFALAYARRGEAHALKEDTTAALADADAAIRLDPACALAYAVRGEAYTHRRSFKQALAECALAIRHDPKRPDAYSVRAWVYNEKRQYDRALREASRAIRLDGKFFWAYSHRAWAHNGKKQYDRALRAAREAIRLAPRQPFAHNHRGVAYAFQGKWSQAVDSYTRAIELKPDYAWAYYNRSVAHDRRGNASQSRADRARALRLNPRLLD
jgi:tetratricopeptide (TPR) repeat protein